MTKKMSESLHPLKNFRPLKNKNKFAADKNVPVSTLENFATNAPPAKKKKTTPYGKLCYSDSHKISYCSEYPISSPEKLGAEN